MSFKEIESDRRVGKPSLVRRLRKREACSALGERANLKPSGSRWPWERWYSEPDGPFSFPGSLLAGADPGRGGAAEQGGFFPAPCRSLFRGRPFFCYAGE